MHGRYYDNHDFQWSCTLEPKVFSTGELCGRIKREPASKIGLLTCAVDS